MSIYIIFSIIIIISFSYIFFLKKKEKENIKKNKEETENEIRKRIFDEEYEKILQAAENKGKLIQKELKTKQVELKLVESSINEKQKFNESLTKIREEELDRLIKTKREEKEAQLKAEMNHQKEQYQKDVDEWVISAQESANLYIRNLLEENRERYELSNEELNKIKEEIHEFSTKRTSINEAIKREREIEEQEEFYKIKTSSSDKEDIELLYNIAPKLNKREAICKLIYDLYIKRPLDELCKRVIGLDKTSGIYKITYIKTGEAYIGQSTDVKNRWHQHIKTTIGLTGAAKQTIHAAMQDNGYWNYTFELLEEVPKPQLNEREKFYVNLYGTKSQYNMKAGG